MKKHKYIWVIIVLVLLTGVVFYVYETSKQNSEKAEFLASLKSLSQDSTNLEKINSFDSIENSGGGWFNINSYDSNPDKDIYYTVAPVHFAGFASTTHLTQQDVYALTDMFKKYSFIGRIKNEVNIGGECTDEKNSSYPCTALEFYLPLSLLTLWFSDPAQWYSNGFIYIPFALKSR